MSRDAVRSDPSPRPAPAPRRGLGRRLRRAAGKGVRWVLGIMLAQVVLVGLFDPPTTWTILTQGTRPHPWTRAEDIAPVMLRSVVAAEDADFCNHWGFDMTEIRRVIARGESRGASTLTQQTAKNVFLWQGRNWLRKAAETLYTPLIEAVWTKRRIVEVYLNVAEFGPGVFGVAAGAEHHFGTTPERLTAAQAAALASVLPAPRTRHARLGSDRARAIADGAATIAADGRAACLEP